MSQVRLDDDQRQQLYGEIRSACQVHGLRPRKVRKAVRSSLTGMGWETILINLAIQFVIPLVLEWLRKKLEPPEVMPAGFAMGLPPAVEMTDTELAFLDEDDDDDDA